MHPKSVTAYLQANVLPESARTAGVAVINGAANFSGEAQLQLGNMAGSGQNLHPETSEADQIIFLASHFPPAVLRILREWYKSPPAIRKAEFSIWSTSEIGSARFSGEAQLQLGKMA